MSTPIHTEDNIDDRLVYAPPWARKSAKVVDKSPASQSSPTIVPEISDSHIDFVPEPPTFEGDVAMIQLRRRLSFLDPDVVPQPPFVGARKAPWAIIAALSVSVVLAVVIAFGVVMVSQSHRQAIRPEKSDRAVQVSDASGRIGSLLLKQSAGTARLLLESQHAYANEPLALQLGVQGASGGESVTVTGLAAGTRLSAGTSLGQAGWRLAGQDIGTILAYPPEGFVGSMNAAFDLRSPNDAVMDSQRVRLEWIAHQAQPRSRAESRVAEGSKATQQPAKSKVAATTASRPIRHLDPEEIEMLLRRGRGLLGTGDIAAARLLLRRAANAGNAEAGLELGASYDPEFLRKLGVLGFAADPEQARIWYQRAAELGSTEAARRVEQLALVR
jgi:hypothetical protein